jgi:hypothetical protein
MLRLREIDVPPASRSSRSGVTVAERAGPPAAPAAKIIFSP